MTQTHFTQVGTFHLITNAQHRVPWCTIPGIPEILIDNLIMSKKLYDIQLYAFCILPNHIHLVVRALNKGIGPFMHSFKRNSSRDAHTILNIPVAEVHEPPLRMMGFMNQNIIGEKNSNIAPLLQVKDLRHEHPAELKDPNTEHSLHIPAAEIRESPLRMTDMMHRSTVRNNASFTGWQKGFYDERIRDDDQFSSALHYVRNNAYGHRLVSKSADWPWSSLHFPQLLDGIE